MYRFFENLVNPYADRSVGTPPRDIIAFIGSEMQPFRRIIPFILFMSFAVAIMETWLISYSGKVIDYINVTDKSEVWNLYGVELFLVALFILFARPVAHYFNGMMQHQALSGSLRDQVRWRAHTHLLGQSRGFFHDDFAGRLANRVMQVGPAVEDNVFTFFDAVWFVSIYFLSALYIMSGISGVLAIPMVLWLIAFIAYIIFMGRKISLASEEMSQTRSMVTARVVDAYTNIESVKLFSGASREQGFALDAAQADLAKFRVFLRLWTRIRFELNILTGILIVGVIGLALYNWTLDAISLGEISIVAALVMRLSAMTGWIMWVSTMLFENAGKIHESMESLAQPQSVTDVDAAPVLTVNSGEIRFRHVRHHYGRDQGR